MEDTLRVKAEFGTEYSCAVLILVLMEDTLRDVLQIMKRVLLNVLILVLMEDTLRDGTFSTLLFLLSKS